MLTTGFGTVAYNLLREFQSRGMDFSVMGVLYPVGSARQEVPDGILPYRIFPPPYEDPYGLEEIAGFVRREKPDVILICNELQLSRTWISRIRQGGIRTPIVVYRGVSCDELTRDWREGLREPDYTIAYTRYAVQVIQKFTGRLYPFFYHGVDRSIFHPYEEERRGALRRLLDWESRFVVMYVGRNHHTKQQPKLLRAFSILKKMGFKDLLCYLHCKPVEEGCFQIHEKALVPMGNNLVKIAEEMGIRGMIRFPEMHNEIHGTPHRLIAPGGEQRSIPERADEVLLADLYNAADFYVHVSEFETFGLPIVEAMSCGLPVAHKNDNGVMNEVCGGAGQRLEPVKGDRNILTRRFGEIAEANIAQVVMGMYETLKDPKKRQAIREQGLERTAGFSWEETGGKMAEIIEDVAKGRRS